MFLKIATMLFVIIICFDSGIINGLYRQISPHGEELFFYFFSSKSHFRVILHWSESLRRLIIL